MGNPKPDEQRAKLQEMHISSMQAANSAGTYTTIFFSKRQLGTLLFTVLIPGWMLVQDTQHEVIRNL